MVSVQNTPGLLKRLQFNRHELAGSFGDIGTDLPLILGMLMATDLRAASVLIVFGVLQILTGLIYGLPMPMQPLKAMAVLIITQHISADVVHAGGWVIGGIMFLLTLTGLLERLVRLIPECVVRGIQFGLGLSLASLALKNYVPAMGTPGYVLAAVGFLGLLAFWNHPRLPAGLVLIALGFAYALISGLPLPEIASGVAFQLPALELPKPDLFWTGLVLLALPQLPLSLSNSVIATEKTVRDLFPERPVGLRKIGFTYAAANLLAPFFGGIPVCHGCGGLAGHYAFGARTGGSVVIYGSFYLVLGLFFSGVLDQVLLVFPKPILGVVLLVESLALLRLIQDQAALPRSLLIALLVGVLALTLPQGYLVGIVTGCVVYYGFKAFGAAASQPTKN
ncbi:MAG: transporter [Bacteroidetes bacterium]|nr:transporter [Bacteroidota bacterium]